MNATSVPADAPRDAYDLFRTALLGNTKPIAWHAGVDAVWTLAVQHGRKLAAADVHAYGTAVCTELGVWSGRHNATGDAVGRAWADAEAVAAQGPVGAGQRLVHDVNSLIADLNSDLDTTQQDAGAGHVHQFARGFVDPGGHVHEFGGGAFMCQTCPHVRSDGSPETEAHACDPGADGRCLYCREELCRG